MSYLNNLLSTVFSGDLGLTKAATDSALSAIIDNPDERERLGIKSELAAMFSDPDTDWIGLLDGEDCEVYYADSQEDARQYVVDSIWNPLFPDEPKGRVDAEPNQEPV